MTTHPTDRLADLVDGTLTGADRDEVLAHVQACASCGAEVRAAGEARAALRGLAAPSTPPGIGDRAVAEARRTAAAGVARNPWAKALPALGVAAAIVLAVALFLPRIGGGGGDAEVPVAADAAGPAASRATALEVIDQDFDEAGVAALAADAPTEAAPSADGVAVGGADGSQSTGRLDPAIDCLTQAFRGLPGTPVRVLQARFLHEPAYLAVLESGPGAGLPADRRYVLVATKDDCTARSQYSEDLP